MVICDKDGERGSLSPHPQPSRRSPGPQTPPLIDPGVQTPGFLLPQTQDSASQPPPPSDSEVQTPSPSLPAEARGRAVERELPGTVFLLCDVTREEDVRVSVFSVSTTRHVQLVLSPHQPPPLAAPKAFAHAVPSAFPRSAQYHFKAFPNCTDQVLCLLGGFAFTSHSFKALSQLSRGLGQIHSSQGVSFLQDSFLFPHFPFLPSSQCL